MANINEIPPFPNPGVRLIKEDEPVGVSVFFLQEHTLTSKATGDKILTR